MRLTLVAFGSVAQSSDVSECNVVKSCIIVQREFVLGNASGPKSGPSCMQFADPIGESTDGQVGAQTSNRLSVPRSRIRLSFVKMRRSKIRPIPVSAVWKVPDDLAQTRVSLHAGKSTPLFSPAASKGR